MYVCSMSKVRVVSVDMDERDGVECAEQQFQHTQSLVKKNKSEIKQEKKMSKTESLFKSKLESLKKFQHSASTNNAVEKARAFFRSLELKHLGSSSNSESSASSSRRRTTTTKNTKDHFPSSSSSSKIPQPSSISSSSSSSIIDDSHNTISTTTTNDSSFYSKKPSNCIATARIIRVINPNYSNPKEMIVQRAIHHEQDDYQLVSSSNFQQVLSQKTVQPPKQYFDDRNPSYAVSFDKRREVQAQYNSRPLSPVSALNPNITYLSHIYPPPTHSTLPNGNISNHQMSASLYEYRPLVCRQMESSSLMSSSFHEQSNRSIDPIIRPLPSSASSTSMSVWTQSVRRLNTEYTSTINALQQAKESLKQISPNSTDTVSKYANFVARGINNLSNNETKKSLGVTFCLTAPISQDSLSLSSSTSSQISKTSIQQNKTPAGNVFCKPKLVRPLDLDTFIPSIPPLPKLEPVPTVIEKNQKVDSIANIIKKFNNLNYSPSKLKSPIIIDNNNNNNSFTSQINTESRDIPSKTIISDSIQSKKDQPNISALTLTTESNPAFENSSPHVHFKSSVTTYQLEELPYESPPPPLTSSSSSSLASEDSTSSTTTTTTTTSTSDGNQIYQNNLFDNHIQEETTYTIETFYKGANNNTENNTNNLSSNHQQVVIIRENTTEEQFNLAREKQHQDQNINQPISSEHKFTTNENNVSPLTTPLLTYLNLTVKQTTPTPPTIEKQEKIHDNYHSAEPSSHITNDFISDVYHHEDDETISDVVTINPYTHSPPSHRLNSSSSSLSSSTTSSASTVLLSNNINPIRPIPSSVTKIPSTTNGNLNKNINKSISQLPKRTTTTTPSATIANVSRLKQPSKIVPSSSKLKPPSSTIPKPIKPMIANNTSPAIATTTTTITSAMRKPTGITNQSSMMTNNSVNKTIQQQSSSSTLITGKKQQLVNGTNMTESQNPTDSSVSLGKNRVRSMVNQLNAAVSSSSSSSSSRPTIPSTVPAKRIPTIISSTVSSRRPVPVEATTTSSNKASVISPSRPSLQRAMTINNQSPVTPSPPSTPPTINNNIPSTYKRKTPLIRSTSNVKEGLLRWCQAQVAGYPNVSVTNLSSSWSDGLAFCALIHHFFPDAFDFNSLSLTNRKDNFELAFRIAEERAGIPQLLDVSDMLMMGNTPDYKCIFTYLNSFLAKVKDIHPTTNGVENH